MTISTREHHILIAERRARAREFAASMAEAAMDATAAATAVRSENTPVLLEERTEGVLRLVMNRPAQRNALSVALMSALQDALERAAADQACRVIIIAGAGPAFCAGHDLRELRSEDDVSEARRETYRRIFAQCSALMLQIVRLQKPVIAEVHGIATAAGCQLVATCDLAVAAAEARFATPGVNIGLFCSTPMVALSRAIGRKPAMEMLLTGELIDAASAKALGLVNRVVPAAELSAATAALASQIAGKSALTLKIGKEAFYRQAELGLADAYKYASEVMTTNMLAQDAAEGIAAFLEKRPPVWRDA
jgi:enoyl-CoA hydratase/carnithine racemase